MERQQGRGGEGTKKTSCQVKTINSNPGLTFASLFFMCFSDTPKE